MRPSVQTPADESALVSGEFPLTMADFRRIAAVLHEDSGIRLSEGKAALVYSRLAKRLRLLGLANFRDYCKLISADEGAEERRAMLMALTTNLTRLFREPHHFEHLKARLLGGLVARAKSGGRLRIWSAGCSTGEEPYSIAMTVLSVLPNAAELDVKILATDIDVNVLAKAKAGLYPVEAAAHVPPAMRQRLRPYDEDTVTIDPPVRSLIAFRELNLMGDWPMRGAFDAIFCRNVAIYFDEPTQEKLWSRFANHLTPDGRLYIGHSERIADSRFATDGQTVYRFAGQSR